MKYLYLILSILLLLCLLPMPYGYYMFVRFVSMAAFGVMSYQSFNRTRRPGQSPFVHLPPVPSLHQDSPQANDVECCDSKEECFALSVKNF